MSVLSDASQRVMEAARNLYDEKLRDQLEPKCNGQIIAIEPESGELVLSRTFREVEVLRRGRFGSKLTYTFRVGGGGAVSIGRGVSRGRIPG